MYRAQFPFKTPPGFRDEPAEYYFDEVSISAFAVNLAAGQQLPNIALVQANSQQGTFEADFYLRGLQVGDESNLTSMGVRLRDYLGNYLSSAYEAAVFYADLTVNNTNGANVEAFEPELYYPMGSVFLLDVANLGSVTLAVNPFPVTLKGVHRFPLGCAA